MNETEKTSIDTQKNEKEETFKILQEIKEKRKKIEAEVQKDLKVDTSDLIQECKDAPNVMQKYLEILSDYRRKLYKKEILLENKEAKWFSYYKSIEKVQGHHFGDLFPHSLTNTDARKMIYRENEMIYLSSVTKEIKEMVSYLEDVVRNFRERNYHIKNIIDIMKLELG